MVLYSCWFPHSTKSWIFEEFGVRGRDLSNIHKIKSTTEQYYHLFNPQILLIHMPLWITLCKKGITLWIIGLYHLLSSLKHISMSKLLGDLVILSVISNQTNKDKIVSSGRIRTVWNYFRRASSLRPTEEEMPLHLCQSGSQRGVEHITGLSVDRAVSVTAAQTW